MISLEAIISLLTLMSFFAICLGTINYFGVQEINFENKIYKINKTNQCLNNVDSFFSNSLFSIKKIDCFVENKKICYGKENKICFETLANIQKEKFLEVEINEHYIK